MERLKKKKQLGKILKNQAQAQAKAESEEAENDERREICKEELITWFLENPQEVYTFIKTNLKIGVYILVKEVRVIEHFWKCDCNDIYFVTVGVTENDFAHKFAYLEEELKGVWARLGLHDGEFYNWFGGWNIIYKAPIHKNKTLEELAEDIRYKVGFKFAEDAYLTEETREAFRHFGDNEWVLSTKKNLEKIKDDYSECEDSSIFEKYTPATPLHVYPCFVDKYDPKRLLGMRLMGISDVNRKTPTTLKGGQYQVDLSNIEEPAEDCDIPDAPPDEIIPSKNKCKAPAKQPLGKKNKKKRVKVGVK